ncbi:MAG TPA: erythromycin esterase family protein [Sphingomonas sp.]|nr:erythromycin esterase family protein [Sphingomonas sp.]
MRGLIMAGVMTALFAGPTAATQPGKIMAFTARSMPRLPQPGIIALGEASHGNEAMLRERNRFIMELAAAGRISWVALETGFAEARLLDRFVKGAPGDAADVAKRGFTSGFGAFAGNVALLTMLRKFNATHPSGERIGIAGVDLSLGGPLASAPTMAPVECALEGVVDRAHREELRTAFTAAVRPGLQAPSVSDAQKMAFHALSDRLAAAIDRTASPDARQCAAIVGQSAIVLDALPEKSGGGGIPPDAWISVSRRDAGMAANAAAILARSHGKSILLFAHTSHVLNAPMQGGRWSTQAQPPESMGQHLAAQLGKRYQVIAQIESASRGDRSTPDLASALAIDCAATCLVPSARLGKLGTMRVRIGINHDDDQLVVPMSAASFFLLLANGKD